MFWLFVYTHPGTSTDWSESVEFGEYTEHSSASASGYIPPMLISLIVGGKQSHMVGIANRTFIIITNPLGVF